jgi:hypothetical protein
MAKRRRRLFTVQTPLSYRVFLERDRWRQIVGRMHRAVAGQEQAVRACLKSPTFIRASANEPDVHLYYVPNEDAYLFVVTAYFTENIKKGNELWTR